jgi:hypothetical protein
MPGSSPGMTSFVVKPHFTGCFLSQTLRSGEAASRRMAATHGLASILRDARKTRSSSDNGEAVARG